MQDTPLLGRGFPLALDRPFTFQQARAHGISRRRLANLTQHGYLRRLLPGVYVAAQTPDSQLLRARAIALVVPTGHVVTDETAGWLAGAEMILRPGAHHAVPPISVYGTNGAGRLRNDLSESGTRGLAANDLVELHGVLATTPLRTALDLGRLLHRDRAIAAIDQLLRLGVFDREELIAGTLRFRGYRGVRQLRVLAPLGDGRSESPGESALRLRFLDGGLPMPTPQVDVFGAHSEFIARVDLVVEDLRFVAEYDGEEWHGPERAAFDLERRERLAAAGWTVRALRRNNLFGARADAIDILRDGVRDARQRLGLGGEPGRRTE